MADAARSRLWIASPYVGAWPRNVRRIVGTQWQSSVRDARLLTDIDAKGYRVSTLQQFGRRGAVASLRGLHAKVYIADDEAIVTSANLTGTAFGRRHEAGVRLSGPDVVAVATVFEEWWTVGEIIDVDVLEDPPHNAGEPGEPAGPPLKKLHELPPDTSDAPLPGTDYGDYARFLECYRELAGIYESVQRLWRIPLFLEVDAFLDYLYHLEPHCPSKAYVRKEARPISGERRAALVKRWASRFSTDIVAGRWDDNGRWRSERSKEVRRLLDKNAETGISRAEFEQLLMQLNAMRSYQVNVAKAVNSANNKLPLIQRVLRDLIQPTVSVPQRIAAAERALFAVSRSSIQELIGFYQPKNYPLRNRNTNAGLRFLGWDVRVS